MMKRKKKKNVYNFSVECNQQNTISKLQKLQ